MPNGDDWCCQIVGVEGCQIVGDCQIVGAGTAKLWEWRLPNSGNMLPNSVGGGCQIVGEKTAKQWERALPRSECCQIVGMRGCQIVGMRRDCHIVVIGAAK